MTLYILNNFTFFTLFNLCLNIRSKRTELLEVYGKCYGKWMFSDFPQTLEFLSKKNLIQTWGL
jgi:hypothetical protein